MTLLVIAAVALGLTVPAVPAPQRQDDRQIQAASVTGSAMGGAPGMKATAIDSVILRENIAVSLADMLAYGSSVFVKQAGRASLSTVSFRGTGSSHTQVLWNGLKLNSPMLGMTDFSMIPSFLVERVSLLHGSSSVSAAPGGFGGAVVLETAAEEAPGFSMQYIQGLGSWMTADEYLRLSYSGKRFSIVAKALVSSSRNNFKYINYDKNENIYDEDYNIIETYHPEEENTNGAWLDFHIMQQIRWDTDKGDRFSLSAWYLNTKREVPRLSVDYGNPASFVNEQRDNALRTAASWERSWNGRSRAKVSAGYAFTDMDYDYARDGGSGSLNYMNRSENRSHAASLQGEYSVDLGPKWHLLGGISIEWQSARAQDGGVITAEGTGIGYSASRAELSVLVSALWKPVPRAGVSLSVREMAYDWAFSAPIPSLGLEYLVSRVGNIRLKASASRNYRHPTLNDLYCLPGGNPDLQPERGFCYDAGWSFSADPVKGRMTLRGEGSWFDSYIEDWILWLPSGSGKNFFTPRNIRKVHAYGVEQTLRLGWDIARDWTLSLNGNFTWSPSINSGEKANRWDESVGKQIVYIPEFSASLAGSLAWRNWRLLYKWCWYSERFTMSSNEYTPSGVMPDYFMSDVTLSKRLSFKWADIDLSLAVRNLFDEDYVTVLSRPMPGINFEAFVGITPRFRK